MKDNNQFAFIAGIFMGTILFFGMSLCIPYKLNRTTCKAIYEKNDNLIIKQCKKYYETKEVEE